MEKLILISTLRLTREADSQYMSRHVPRPVRGAPTTRPALTGPILKAAPMIVGAVFVCGGLLPGHDAGTLRGRPLWLDSAMTTTRFYEKGYSLPRVRRTGGDRSSAENAGRTACLGRPPMVQASDLEITYRPSSATQERQTSVVCAIRSAAETRVASNSASRVQLREGIGDRDAKRALVGRQ